MPNPWEMNWAQPQGGGMEAVPLPGKPEAPPSGYRPAPGGLEFIPGGPADPSIKPPGARSATEIEIEEKKASAQKRAATIQAITGEVKRLYSQDIKGQPLSRGFGALEYIDSIPTNDRFQAAGNTILPLIRPLIAQTAKEGDSDKEMTVFQSYVPSNNDSDISIEQKFKMLDLLVGGMVDGVPPSQTLASVSAAPAVGDRPTTAPGIIMAEPSTGVLQTSTEVKTVNDEALAKIAPQIGTMVSRGMPAANIRMFMKKNGVDPSVIGNLDEILSQRGNPNSDVSKWIKAFPGKPYPIDTQYEVPLSGFEKAEAESAASAEGAALRNFANAATAGNLARISGAIGGDEAEAEQNRSLALGQSDHPYASLGGTVAGGVSSTLAAEAALARLGMAPGYLRALVADTGYGATAGGSSAGEGENWLGEGAEGALAAFLGSLAGQKLTKGLGSVTGGVKSQPVRSVLAENIPLTIGQATGQSGLAGRFIKGVEDRAMGLGVDGGQIGARRLEGVQAFNSKSFEKALEPIKGSVGGKFGEEAVAEAQDIVSQAFNDALAGQAATVDRAFITQAAAAKNAIQKLARNAPEVEKRVDEVVASYFDPATLTITGENMQAVLRDLGRIKRSYAGDPLEHEIGQAVGQVESSIEGLFTRQAPDVLPQYNAAKKAYKRLSTIEDAVNSAKNTGGVFTPAQLGMADRANTKKFGGKKAAAAGKSEFQDFQRPMQEVLPSQVPDSGTAGRLATLAVPGSLVAGGYAAGGESGATSGLTLAALLAAAYTRTGQKMLTGLVAKRGPGAQKVGEQIRKGARVIGSGVGTTAALETTRGQ